MLLDWRISIFFNEYIAIKASISDARDNFGYKNQIKKCRTYYIFSFTLQIKNHFVEILKLTNVRYTLVGTVLSRQLQENIFEKDE